MATKTADEIDELEEDELEDDDDDDDPDAGKTDEELRAELKSVRASLEKANGQSAKRRRTLREREAELEAERSKKKPAKKADDAETVDVDEIRAAALREGAAPAILRAKKAEAKSALLAAGVNPERVAKATGLLDLDDLDLDDDGLDGVDDEIEKLRKSWPELFVRPRKKRESTAGDRDEDRKPGGTKTASQLAADKLLGRG